ncbi:hypothetical protein LEP1GSC043_2383, partial [Leptospira weilii str. Ecochallenge]
QIEIKSIFQTSFIGKRARGIGNLGLVKDKNLMVAAPLVSEKIEPAIVERKKETTIFPETKSRNRSAPTNIRSAWTLPRRWAISV